MSRFPIHILCWMLLSLPGWAAAEIYLYVDKDGVSHYTNVPTSSRYKPVRLESLNTPRGRPAAKVQIRTHRSIRNHNPAHYDDHIKRAALRNMIDPLLIKAIIKAESDFDQNAVSRSGAQGLMQLMPETARDLRVANPFDPAQNISGGTRYFRKMLNSYDGDLSKSLAAYNAGPSRVAKKGPLPRIRETREYVRRVIRNYRSYQHSASTAAPLPDNINVGKLVTVN